MPKCRHFFFFWQIKLKLKCHRLCYSQFCSLAIYSLDRLSNQFHMHRAKTKRMNKMKKKEKESSQSRLHSVIYILLGAHCPFHLCVMFVRFGNESKIKMVSRLFDLLMMTKTMLNNFEKHDLSKVLGSSFHFISSSYYFGAHCYVSALCSWDGELVRWWMQSHIINSKESWGCSKKGNAS